MLSLSGHTGPGYLCITSQPRQGYVDEYNIWNDSEFGPLRLQLDVFLNGYRYRSTEDPSIQLTTYDLETISGLTEPSYTTLTSNPSRHEQNIISHQLTHLDQRIYTPLSTRGHLSQPAPIMMSVAFVVPDAHIPELHRWYEEEHTHDLQQIPGWQRSRRFQLLDSTDLRPGHTELLAVHEFSALNGLDGPEHALAKARPWRNRILGLVVSRRNQRFEFVHEMRARDYQQPVAKAISSTSSTESISSGTSSGISKTYASGN